MASSPDEINQNATDSPANLGQSLGKVERAALWLSRNRDAVRGPLIRCLRRKFDLTTLEAIEAAKAAHALEYPGVAQ